jgi:hypothetical protein
MREKGISGGPEQEDEERQDQDVLQDPSLRWCGLTARTANRTPNRAVRKRK